MALNVSINCENILHDHVKPEFHRLKFIAIE